MVAILISIQPRRKKTVVFRWLARRDCLVSSSPGTPSFFMSSEINIFHASGSWGARLYRMAQWQDTGQWSKGFQVQNIGQGMGFFHRGYNSTYRKFRTVSRDFFTTLSTLRLIQWCGLSMYFSKGRSSRKEWDRQNITIYRHMRLIVRCGLCMDEMIFPLKNVLGAAYNQVRFIVRNLQ